MGKKKERILVGMSGGVDSSVTAALLKKRGYDVIGITMQLLPEEKEKISACCNLGAVSDAKRVCQKLKIPHYTINSRDVFQKKVMSHFVDQYKAGYTPNPCVECNRYIKFDEILAKADDLDAKYIATGHYSLITYNSFNQSYYLKKGKDPQKDQSYFLYMLQQETLKRLKFPLGGYQKSEIREIANSLGLINANKPDSQDICFIAKNSYKSFVESHIEDPKALEGPILDESGKELGRHKGLYQYTIGQRRGIDIPSQNPLYVLKIDRQNQSIIVGPKNTLKTKLLSLRQFTIVTQHKFKLKKEYQLKTRYQMTPQVGTVLSLDGDKAEIEMLTPHGFIAPGQSCVVYDGEFLIGGGIIC